MKLIALLGAGALAVGTMMAAAPADAQRYGYGHDYGRYDDHRGYGRDHYRRDDYRPHRGNYYGGGYGYRGGGYGHGGGRLVCRVHRGYYGPVRRCFRVYR